MSLSTNSDNWIKKKKKKKNTFSQESCEISYPFKVKNPRAASALFQIESASRAFLSPTWRATMGPPLRSAPRIPRVKHPVCALTTTLAWLVNESDACCFYSRLLHTWDLVCTFADHHDRLRVCPCPHIHVRRLVGDDVVGKWRCLGVCLRRCIKVLVMIAANYSDTVNRQKKYSFVCKSRGSCIRRLSTSRRDGSEKFPGIIEQKIELVFPRNKRATSVLVDFADLGDKFRVRSLFLGREKSGCRRAPARTEFWTSRRSTFARWNRRWKITRPRRPGSTSARLGRGAFLQKEKTEKKLSSFDLVEIPELKSNT